MYIENLNNKSDEYNKTFLYNFYIFIIFYKIIYLYNKKYYGF